MSEQLRPKIVRNSDGSIAWALSAEQTARLRPGTYVWTLPPEWEVVSPFSADELQAIRKALLEVTEEDRYAFGGVTLPAESLANRGLPPSVVAWVLDGET